MKKKQILALALAALMTVTAFAGCGNNSAGNTATNPPTATKAPTASNAPDATVEDDVPQYEHKTIRWLYKAGSAVVPEDSYICQKILEDINISYVHMPPGDNSEETLNMLLASGNVPDLFASWDDMTTKLIEEDWIVPLEDYFTDEWIPNVIRVANNWDMAVQVVTRDDGHTWGLPSPNTPAVGPTPGIRVDWLQNLGREMPTTLDELFDTLVAFANDDPDGDGVANTFGTAFMNDGYDAGYLDAVFATEAWYLDTDGLVINGGYTERGREKMKWLNELMNQGALPLDTISYTEDILKTMIISSQIGYSYGYNDYEGYNRDLQTVAPNANFDIAQPVKGNYYDTAYINGGGGILREHSVVFKQCDMEGLFRLWNYMADDKSTDSANPTFEGTYWTSRYGERGVDWDVTPEGLFDMGNGEQPNSAAIKANLEANPWKSFGTHARIRSKFDTANILNQNPLAKRIAETYFGFTNTNNLPANTPSHLVPLVVEGMVFPIEIQEFAAAMQPHGNQLMAEVLKKGADVDRLFDNYLAEAQRQGLDNMRQLATEAYRAKGIID